MFQLNNKIALITGAAGGLGRTFAEAFAEQGCKVLACDLDIKGAQETAQIITERQQTCVAVQADVCDADSLQAVLHTATTLFGGIDILINNAAIYAGLERKPFFDITEKEWDKVLDVNLKGVWLCTKIIAPLMRERRGGKIINIASATVMSGSPMWAHYVASKAGVIGLTRVMAKELGEFNINVNAIAPGFTLTEASLSLIENARQYGVDRGAIKRPSTADDIAGTALYLASSAADFVSGQTIVVDGGKQFL